MTYRLVYTRQALKDAKKLKGSSLAPKAKKLLDLLAVDPFTAPPSFEALVGELSGAYSRRMNVQHRLVYQVLEKQKIVKVLRMWTHYE